MMFEKLHNFSQSNSNIFRRLVLIKLLLTTDKIGKSKSELEGQLQVTHGVICN